MKRTVVGILWFLGFFFGSGFMLGLAIAQSGTVSDESPEEIEEIASDAGEHLGGLIFLVSAGAATYGTVTQKLPGTK